MHETLLFSDRTHRVAIIAIAAAHEMSTAIEVEVARDRTAIRYRAPIVAVATCIIER